MVVVIAVSQVLPQSEFSYGLYTFNMNAAMMVWFAYLLAAGGKNAKKVEGRGNYHDDK